MNRPVRPPDRLLAPPKASRARSSGWVQPASYFLWKDLVGRCVALVLFVVGLPPMLLAMLVVKLTSPGPAIYSQTRVGRDGRVFRMYKIRSMRCDAETVSGAVWSTLDDPRVTPVGRWLRRLHLDELPQLINVLRGEMALIGPRPERPEFVQKLAVQVPGYLNRLAVRPGITGLAQINLPPDTTLDDVRRKLVADLHYLRHGSAWLDVRIFLCTFCRLFGLTGGMARTVCGVNFHPDMFTPHPAALLDDSKAEFMPA